MCPTVIVKKIKSAKSGYFRRGEYFSICLSKNILKMSIGNKPNLSKLYFNCETVKSKFFWEKIKVNNRPVPQGVNITWIKNMEVQRGESIVSFPSLFTCVLIDIHISWKTVG